jgi:hypothetical protein
MAVLNLGADPEWDTSKNKIPIGYVRAQERLLARIVMQNIWPISRNSDVPLDRAKMIYAIKRRIPLCMCTHMVMIMLELHEDHVIALPFGGLISKILTAKLPKIDGNELV